MGAVPLSPSVPALRQVAASDQKSNLNMRIVLVPETELPGIRSLERIFGEDREKKTSRER